MPTLPRLSARAQQSYALCYLPQLDLNSLDDYQKEAVKDVIALKRKVMAQIREEVTMVPAESDKKPAPKALERMLEAQLEEDLERIESLLLDATRR